MPACEMCGKETSLFKVLIEGTELNVCEQCTSYGKVLKKPVFVPKEKKGRKSEEKSAEEEKEIIEGLVEDYSKKVKDARQKQGLKQEELAKKINEKESIIQKIETSNFRPGIKLAKKLENFLGIKLIENIEVEKIKLKKERSEGFTLGDFIKVKKH